MQDEVKELAEKMLAALDSFEMEWEWTPTLLDGEVVGYKSVKPSERGMRNLTDYLARVALEYVEERRKEQAEKLLTAEFVPWETGALPVPVPLYVRGIVCSICHKEVTLKYDEETQSYIARENCDCIKEQP